jgi:hypothetical protein
MRRTFGDTRPGHFPSERIPVQAGEEKPEGWLRRRYPPRRQDVQIPLNGMSISVRTGAQVGKKPLLA